MASQNSAGNGWLNAESDPHRVPVLPPPAALVEFVVLSGAIMLADWLFTSIDIAEVHPNPYWVPVLLLSLQYGAVSGMLAAIIASIATIYAGFPEQGVGENYFVYFMRVWAQPILWLGVAIVVGQFRTRQIATKQALRRSLHELTAERAALAEHAGNLRRRCEALERDIAGREDRSSAPAFLDRVADLASGVAFPDAFRAMIGSALPGANVVIYRRGLDGFAVEATMMPAAGLVPQRHLAVGDPLVAAMKTRAVVSVLDAEGERLLAGRGLAAVAVGQDGDAGPAGLLLVLEASGELVRDELVKRLAVLGTILATMTPSRAPAGATNDIEISARDPERPWRQRRWLRARRSGGGAVTAGPAGPKAAGRATPDSGYRA